MEIEQQSLFDYDSLDHETCVFVQEKAQSIRIRLKHTAEDIIAIGQDLIAVKSKLGHGKFLPWLKSEFGMTDRHALNFMRVASRFSGKSEIISDFSITVLYELASPSTPDSIIEQVQSGEIPATMADIRDAKREYLQSLPPQPVPSPLPETRLWQQPSVSTKNETIPPPSNDVEDSEETCEETEEDRYHRAIDTGTLEYYHDGLVRDAIQHDKEEREKRISGTPPALQMSESNEWYTPAPYVEAARLLMGDIDTDPASIAYANEKVVHAATYYDIETNGLAYAWIGRIWLNPPYGRDEGESNQEIWSRRLVEQFDAGNTTEAVLLVNAVTDRKWFQPLWRFPICFTDHRIRFYNAEKEAGQPTHGNALIYLGPQEKEQQFIDLFKQFGVVVRKVSGDADTKSIIQ